MSVYTQLYAFAVSILFIKFTKSLINYTTFIQQLCATKLYTIWDFV